MQLYGIKTCDTCRKALRALAGAGHEVTFCDLRATPLSAAQIEGFLAVFGADLINRRSTTWKSLSESARSAAPATLLAQHPTLMKRPLIEAEGALYLGWSPEVQRALIP